MLSVKRLQHGVLDRVGADAQGKSAILSGLEAGQKIVLSGQFLIDSEASMKSKVSRLSSAEPQP